MSELITGEGVVLDLRVARLPTRALGFTIDAVVLVGLAIGVSFVLGATVDSADPALAATLGLVGIVAVLVGIPVTVETLSRGRSLGKLALGLRVVRDDGGPAGFRHALARGLAGFFVDFWLTLGAGAVICSILSKDGKRIGDLLAGTVVVKERTPARILPLPPMPPPLAAWAPSLELSRLPDDLALAVRTYLTRGGDLAPGSREAMGERLAQAVASYVSPAPPSGTPAWAYLAAVLAERRRRSEASLHAYLTATPVSSSPLLFDATAPRVNPVSTQRHPPSNLSTQGGVASNGELTQGHVASEPGGFAAPV